MAERLTFSASVEVRAPAAEAFALVSDLRLKARLNPAIQVIRVELEGGEPVREGSVFYHRFQRGQRILAYRTRVVRLESPRLLETRSETDPPFQVRVTVEPTAGGCRLTQEEAVEAEAALLDALDPAPPAPGLPAALGWLPFFPGGRRLAAELRAHQRHRVCRRLAGELGVWLEAIGRHLESGAAPGAEGGAR